MGTDTRIARVWVEHVKAGCWCGRDRATNPTTNMVISDSRFRNIYADGVNFDNGSKNSKVINTHFRNTGDDAMAIWAYKGAGDSTNTGNSAKNITVQMPWRANCFAIYGGESNTIEDSICEDVLTYPGFMAGNLFDPHPFTGMSYGRNLTIIRGGGLMYNQQMGAVRLFADQGPVDNLSLENISIIDSTYSGLQLAGGNFNNVHLKNITIDGANTDGVILTGSVQGRVTAEGVVVKNVKGKGLEKGSSPDSFFDRKSGNTGW